MMPLKKLIQGSRNIRLLGDGSVGIRGIAEDSREVQSGHLFAGLAGTRTDGGKFIADALARGAAAVLLAEDCSNPPHTVPVVLGKDPRKTLAEIAAAFHSYPSSALKVVGVTGTNGKTTTTFLIKQLLEGCGMPSGWIGTVGYALGSAFLPSSHTTPSALRLQMLLDRMRSEHLQAVSMEVSSHALDQRRADAIDFDVAVFTNLTRDHLDYHGDFSSYLRAKARLFALLNDSFKPGRCAVLNADDPACCEIQKGVRTPVLTYGLKGRADVSAGNVHLEKSGASFDLKTPAGEARMTTPLLGGFNVLNALAAAAAGIAIGIALKDIVRVLSTAQAPTGRMEFIEGNQPFSVVIDYAHTDDALRNVLMAVREFTAGRVLAVFGCGGDRDRGKRPLMGGIAQELASFSYLTSDNPRSEDPRAIIREIETGFTEKDAYGVYVDRTEAIEQAIHAARAGDMVLIAGKGHEQVQVLKDGPVPFSDRQVAQRVLQEGWASACRV